MVEYGSNGGGGLTLPGASEGAGVANDDAGGTVVGLVNGEAAGAGVPGYGEIGAGVVVGSVLAGGV